jgi:hypothetical protein
MAEKRHYCWNCGDDMGPWTKYSDRDDVCGKTECNRAARDQWAMAREEAHEQLDRDMGWY